MRKRTQGGQALVMVTLGLVSMCGMLGLAVDLGWSFFVQKQAQAAADFAALSAVQEAVTRLGSSNVSGFTCVAAGTGANQVDCETSAIVCGSVVSTSNLHNGCQYAAQNGFDPATNASQNVTVQSSDGADPNRPPGVNRIAYWVTVRAAQSTPQLFSAVLGNKSGLVAAVATAGIVGAITPGSFFGMNRAGDCSEGGVDCGLDFETGHGKGGGAGGSQACGPNGLPSDFCAPAGIILASSCGAGGGPGCDQNYAGNEQGSSAMGSSLTIMGPAGLVKGTTLDLNGNPLVATHSTDQRLFRDPTAPNPQPAPLTAASSMGTCAIPSGAAPLTGNLGPYVYFSYSSVTGAGLPIPDGLPIRVSGTVNFSQGAGSAAASSPCPVVSANGLSTIATAGNQVNPNFPTYVFVGGLNQTGGTMNVGPGQYLMAGTSSTTGSVFSYGGVVDGSSSQAQATGSMFIFTDAAYPGMNLAGNSAANFTPLVTGAGALNQGTVTANGSLEMYGLVNSTVGGGLPASLNNYTGVVWWQDRRNSSVGYNEPSGSPGCGGSCTGDDGSVIYCNIGCVGGSTDPLTTANHVTATSPGGVQFGNGNTKMALNGVYYQPRGAWTDLGNGNTGFNCPATNGRCPLQLITGALFMGSGTTRMVLSGPTNPLITYKAALIQ